MPIVQVSKKLEGHLTLLNGFCNRRQKMGYLLIMGGYIFVPSHVILMSLVYDITLGFILLNKQ